MTSYKPIFYVDTVWCDNQQRFATHDEAKKSAASRFSRWTVPTNYGVAQSTDPVNTRWDDEEGDVMLPEEAVAL